MLPMIVSQQGQRPPIGHPGEFGAATTTDALSGKRVLLVEDEAFIAFDLTFALERVGVDVVHARTLAQALHAVSEQEFDAAILDVTLGTDQTCRPVADELDTKGTPYIIHSGDLARHGEVLETLDAPIIPKPAQANDVVSALARTLVTG